MIREKMPLYRDEFHHISEYASGKIARIFVDWAATELPEILRRSF